uniref:KRAB-related domain-containing protein n=1 Tax=Aotus nancymaae TaxID=37293 RepID=A0A2K5E810_AOTNA
MNGDDNSSAKKPGDDEQILEDKCEDFDDIAQYFSKNEWEKLKYSEKSTYAYIKENYESLRRLGFHIPLPLFMHSKWTENFWEDDSHRDSNPGTIEMPLILFICDLHITKIMPGEPPEEKENDSEAVPETSGTQNDVKPPCYPLCTSITSEKMDKIPGHREAQEKEERCSQNTHNIDRLSLSSFMGAVPGTPKTITHNRNPKGRNMPGPIDCVRERLW